MNYESFKPITGPSEFPWRLAIQYLKGVGPHRAFLLKKLAIETLEDFLYFIPFRYEDRTVIGKIGSLCPGKEQTILVKIQDLTLIKTRRIQMNILDITVSDDTGSLHIKWFNQPYLKDLFKTGDCVMFSGMVKENNYGGYHLEMETPQYEKMDEEASPIHVGRIVPIYHETKGITSRFIRMLMHQILHQYAQKIIEMLPSAIIQRHSLIPLSEAILMIHFPPEGSDLSLLNSGESLAHRRLSFDEMFLLQTGLAIRKKDSTVKTDGISFNTAGTLVERLIKQLPFPLTRAQERVVYEIKGDMKAPHPMNRLIHGDVGCGKTLVALMAILIAIDNQYQTAMMVPTEILAEQHFFSLKGYLEALGKSVGLLVSDMKKNAKNELREKIASGEMDLVIGTHALIQDEIQFQRLGLVVVDEQHKFGVLQRAQLIHKGVAPDILIMTATPIPRTLALTLYGDLNVSVIDELPPGRSPIQTLLFYERQRGEAYRLIDRELSKGRQAYLVCPLVEESEKIDLKAATKLHEVLQKETLIRFKIGLLHGRLRRDEKESTLQAFAAGAIDLLVATTVVEVGIDIPNATLMVIEHAERFGLSQLHQLRGRVGRGAEKSYCVMIANHPISREGRERLNTMVKNSNGFSIAEADLIIRGPGEFLGTRQSGLPELKIANLIRDAALLESARLEAFNWIEHDPGLNHAESIALRAHLERKWAGKLEHLRTG